MLDYFSTIQSWHVANFQQVTLQLKFPKGSFTAEESITETMFKQEFKPHYTAQPSYQLMQNPETGKLKVAKVFYQECVVPDDNPDISNYTLLTVLLDRVDRSCKDSDVDIAIGYKEDKHFKPYKTRTMFDETKQGYNSEYTVRLLGGSTNVTYRMAGHPEGLMCMEPHLGQHIYRTRTMESSDELRKSLVKENYFQRTQSSTLTNAARFVSTYIDNAEKQYPVITSPTVHVMTYNDINYVTYSATFEDLITVMINVLPHLLSSNKVKNETLLELMMANPQPFLVDVETSVRSLTKSEIDWLQQITYLVAPSDRAVPIFRQYDKTRQDAHADPNTYQSVFPYDESLGKFRICVWAAECALYFHEQERLKHKAHRSKVSVNNVHVKARRNKTLVDNETVSVTLGILYAPAIYCPNPEAPADSNSDAKSTPIFGSAVLNLTFA